MATKKKANSTYCVLLSATPHSGNLEKMFRLWYFIRCPFNKVFRLDYYRSFGSLYVAVDNAVAISEYRFFDLQQYAFAQSEKKRSKIAGEVRPFDSKMAALTKCAEELDRYDDFAQLKIKPDVYKNQGGKCQKSEPSQLFQKNRNRSLLTFEYCLTAFVCQRYNTVFAALVFVYVGLYFELRKVVVSVQLFF